MIILYGMAADPAQPLFYLILRTEPQEGVMRHKVYMDEMARKVFCQEI